MSQPQDNDSASVSSAEEALQTYNSQEECDAARQEALRLFNENKLEEALNIQHSILQHNTTAHGEISEKCGVAYLDYGVTLLAIIQSQAPEQAMVAQVDNEDLDICYMNLDAARVCLEKLESKDPEDQATQRRMAEVHDSLALLMLEQDNADGAIGEFEHVLMVLNNMKEKDHKRIIGTLFSIGSALLQNEDAPGAVERLEECLKAIEAAPAGSIDPVLTNEVKIFLGEAKEATEKPEEMQKVKDEIHALFPDENSMVQDPEEFEAQQSKPANQFLVPVSAEVGGASRSVPLALMTPMQPEDGNSNSMSFFPKQTVGTGEGSASRGATSLSTGAVNVVTAVRKKPKASSELDAKRKRSE